MISLPKSLAGDFRYAGFKVLSVCIVFFMASVFSGQVKAGTLSDVSVRPQVGTLTYGTPGSVTFKVYLTKTGGGGTGNITIGVTGLSAGLTYSFSSQGFPIPGNVTIDSSAVMTVTTTGAAKVGSVFTVTAKDGNNAAISATSQTIITINPLPLSPVFSATTTKVYDGTTTSSIATRSLSGSIINSDVVTLTGGTAVYGNKSVGTGKTVTATGFSLSGAGAGNYYLSTTSATATNTAAITALGITGTVTANNKVYDGTTTATIASGNVSGVLSGDVVSLAGGTASFNNKNVGTGKTVSVSGLSLSGADAGNYSVSSTASTTANITVLNITNGVTVNNKVYDKTTAATIASGNLSGVVSGDVVSLTSGTAVFSDKNVGTGKTVSISGLSLSGTDAGNYSVSSTASTTANITALGITGTVTANNKVYDANTSAVIASRNVSGVLSGDVVSLTGGTAVFSDKNVGTGKTVSVSGLSLSGTDAGNYSVSSTASTTANITALGITGTITASNKVYDGATAATIASRNVSGVLSGDVVSLTGGTAVFSDKNVGTGKTVSVSGLSLSGTDAGNYSVSSTASTTANITALGITGTVTASNKVYDGTTAATIDSRSLSGTVSGDVVSLTGGTAVFGDKNVGTGKTVSVSGLSLSGTDAGNYTVSATASATADITALALTPLATINNKVYDGTTAATIASRSVSGVLSGDDVSLTGGTATFNHKNVGTSKVVLISGLSLSGADAGNYLVASSTGTTADITAAPITITADAKTKVYGDADPSLTYTITSGALIGNDVFTGSLQRVAGESVNTYAINQGDVDAGSNYQLSYTGANLTITARAISASGNAPGILCTGGSTVLTISASGGNGVAFSYQLGAGTPQSGNTFNITAGTYTVTVSDGFVSVQVPVTVSDGTQTVPLQPGKINGGGERGNLCGGGVFNYALDLPVAGAISYTWSIPAHCSIIENNGTSIKLQADADNEGGVLSVTPNNTCGSGLARVINLVKAPWISGVISGPSSVTARQTITLTEPIIQDGKPLYYYWTVPGGVTILSGQGTPTVVMKWRVSSGQVTLREINDCDSSNPRKFDVTVVAAGKTASTDVSQIVLKGNTSFKMYPNPVHDVTTLSFNAEKAAAYTVQITDVTGRALLSVKVAANAGANNVQLNVSTLKTGIYNVVITDAANGKHTQKLVKVAE